MNRIDDTQLARTVAALASAGAGAIHIAVLPAHIREWWAAGAFFAAIATFQVVWAIVAYASQRRAFLALGGAVNAATVALWIETRTAGLPFGPNAGVPEHVGLAGVLTVVLESAVCAAVIWSLRPHERRTLPSVATSSLAVGSAVVIVCGLAVPGVVAGAGHRHSAGHTHHSHHHDDQHERQADSGQNSHDQGDHAKRHRGDNDHPSGKPASANPGPTASSPDPSGDPGRRRDDHHHDHGHHH